MSVLEAAREATQAGFVVLPAKEDGSKRPDLAAWERYTHEPPTREELRHWFAESERTGMGLVMGAVSGHAECLDFDDAGIYEAFCALCTEAGVSDLLERVTAGYHEETPRGVHLVYRCPEGVEGNQKLAQRPDGNGVKALIETRGEGGWVVCAPSNGRVHESGKPYVLYSGGPGEVATLSAEEREVLLSIARSMDETPRAVPQERAPHGGAGAPASGDRPGDVFDAQATWAEVLEPHGWTRLWERGGLCYWRRPGKTGPHVSATTGPRGGDPGADYLWVFSTSVSGLDTEQGYSKFRAYAVLNHGGDWRAAAQELGARGYRAPVTELVAPQREEQDGAVPDVVVHEGAVPGPEVRAPVHRARALFRGQVREAAYAFPAAYPPEHFVSRYIAYASQRTDAAHDFHEAVALTILAAATPGVRAFLTPWPHGLPTNLYMLLVGDSTRSRKSTALGIGEDVLDDALGSARLSDQFTPESLIEQIAARQGKPAVWMADEFGEHLDAIHNKQYMAGVKGLLLTVYAGKDYVYQRHSKRVKGGGTEQDVDRIVDPHLCVLGAATPTLFDSLTTKDVDTGLLPRFAFVMPRRFPPRMSAHEVPPELSVERTWLRDYAARLYRWSLDASSWRDPDGTRREQRGAAVEFSRDAHDVMDAWEMEVEHSGHDILSRLPAMGYKLAMLSALGEEVPRVPRLVIERRDAERAVSVARRLRDFALEFNDLIGGKDTVDRKFDAACDKVLRRMEVGEEVLHMTVAKWLEPMRARDVREVQETLVGRGLVEIVQGESTGGRAPMFWRRLT